MTSCLLEVKGVSKSYRFSGGRSSALEGVNIRLEKGEAIGIAGPSGAGKSTLARIICGMERPTEGSVFLHGKDLKEDSRLKRKIQMIWQDPAASLNPYMTAAQLICEPLEVFGSITGQRARRKVIELAEMAGLDEYLLIRKPHELSGGQCARTAAARALAADPLVLVCDESFSSLDVSSQEEFLGVLEGLMSTSKVSLIIISHDVFPIRRICSRTAVICDGRIAEIGKTREILSNPHSPWAREMISSLIPWPFHPAADAR